LGELDQGSEAGVGVDLLLHAGEFDQFLGELIGAHRTAGILVL